MKLKGGNLYYHIKSIQVVLFCFLDFVPIQLTCLHFILSEAGFYKPTLHPCISGITQHKQQFQVEWNFPIPYYMLIDLNELCMKMFSLVEGLNPQPLDCESSTITIRPQLVATKLNFSFDEKKEDLKQNFKTNFF